jgi:hypothetical protein
MFNENITTEGIVLNYKIESALNSVEYSVYLTNKKLG